MSLPWLGACLALSVVASQQLSTVYGPFRVVPRHMDECPPEMRPTRKFYTANVSAVRDRSKTDVWLYSVNGTLFDRADDNYTMSFNVASWSSMGGWKDNAYMIDVPKLCNAFKSFFPDLWKRLVAGGAEPEKVVCPLMPGYYSISNVSTDFNIDFPRAFFFGKWRGTAYVTNSVSKERTACLRVFFDTVPKMAKGKTSSGKRPPDFSKLIAKLNITKFNTLGSIP